jgi:ankyrin repeat protein
MLLYEKALKNGMKPSFLDENCDFMLPERGSTGFIKFLLKYGLDPNEVDNNGNTLLHFYCKFKTQFLLLIHGANVSIKNKQNKLPIDQQYDNINLIHHLHNSFKINKYDLDQLR